VEAPKSLNKIIFKTPNLASNRKNGQHKVFFNFSLDFFMEVLISKIGFESSERCRSRFGALVDVGARGGRAMEH
jgi:hypothetical protein